MKWGSMVCGCLVCCAGLPAAAQLDLHADSYVFLVQDTSDAGWYVRAFDGTGALYSELALNVAPTPVYTGFAISDGRLFATKYIEQIMVEFDPLTGDPIASFDADPGEDVIGLDADGGELFVNGFSDWTAVYSHEGDPLGLFPKPGGFTGGGLISVYGDSLFYYDEQTDVIYECDSIGGVLDTISLDNTVAFPDGMEYDPVADEFIMSSPGRVRRFDRQGVLVGSVTLDGFGASFHNGLHYVPIPAPATVGLVLSAAVPLLRRGRKPGAG